MMFYKIKLSIIVLYLVLSSITPSIVDATKITSGNCSVDITPYPILIPTGKDRLIVGSEIKFKTTVQSTGTYKMLIQSGLWPIGQGSVTIDNLVSDANGLLGGSTQIVKIGTNNWDAFKEGPHKIEISRHGSPGNYCEVPFEVRKEETGNQVTCTISTINPTNDATDVKLGGTIGPEGKYRFNIPFLNKTSDSFDVGSSGSFPEQNFGRLNPDTHQIFLQREITRYDLNLIGTINQWIQTNCVIQALVVKTEKELPTPGNPSAIGTGTPGSGVIPGPSDICKTDSSKCSSAKGDPCSNPNDPNPGFKTAIGCIHTNPVALVKDILTFAVAISGGLAFLMMLLGAYQMLTSQGNPETLGAGKDRLTNAVIGLLFIIFSVLLLQIIGVDILRIPGFER